MQDALLGSDIEKLGFGMMRLPRAEKEIDMPQVKAMVDRFMEHGFTYFDTAYSYDQGDSERAVGEAVVKRYPRESFQIATKLPIWMVKTPTEMMQVFEESLRRIGVEYIDYYLLHNLDEDKTGKYEEFGAWEFGAKLKDRGLIRHFGFSFHDRAEKLDTLLAHHPEVDFVQLQLNYGDWESPVVQSRKCYEVARKYQKPIIVMEPVKGGSLVNLPPKAIELLKQANPHLSPAGWALRFCSSLEGVITILSGMSSMAQMEDNIATIKDTTPLSDKERDTLRKVADILAEANTIPCTNCRYCVDDCPQDIKIPMYFHLTNDFRMFGNRTQASDNYKLESKDHGKASDCIECGVCVEHCPQHLPVSDLLKEVVELFE